MPLALTRRRLPLLFGGAPRPPVDLGTLLVDLDERKLDGATIVDLYCLEDTYGAAWTDGYVDLTFTGPVTGTVRFAFNDDVPAMQAALDGEFGADVAVIVQSTTPGYTTLADASLTAVKFLDVQPTGYSGDFHFGSQDDPALVLRTHAVTVPDQSGNGNDAVIYDADHGGPDGSTEHQGFLVGTDHGHTTLTARYGHGQGPLDSRMVCPADLSGPHTIYTLRTVGDDAPVDNTEMCPLTFDPGTNLVYSDWYITDGDRLASYANAYEIGAQTGGPQVGDCIIEAMTRTGDDGDPLMASHIDGFDPSPRTIYTYGSNSGSFYPSPSGVMIANYPEGGYAAPGRVMRVLIYEGVHTPAQRSLIRHRLRGQAIDAGFACPLYPDTTNPFENDVPNVFPDIIDAADIDWTERFDAEEEPPDDDTTNLTGWTGQHGTVLTADGDPIPVSAVQTPSGRAVITFPEATVGRLVSDALEDLGWFDGTGTLFVVLRSASLDNLRPVVVDGTDDGHVYEHFAGPIGHNNVVYFFGRDTLYSSASGGAMGENKWIVAGLTLKDATRQYAAHARDDTTAMTPFRVVTPPQSSSWRIARFLVGAPRSIPWQAPDALPGDVAFIGYLDTYLNTHDMNVVLEALAELEGIT